MHLTQAHEDLLRRAREITSEFGDRITGPEWAQDRNGDFLVLYVDGKRRWLDVTDEMIEDHRGGAGDTWRIVEGHLRGIIRRAA